MTMRSPIYNNSTPGLYEITDWVRIIASPGPKWQYTLRPVDLEYDSGDVKPYSQSGRRSVTGYNIWELDNTTTTWFGLSNTEYQGLEFNPAPIGAIVHASSPTGSMVDNTGAPDTTKTFWLLFQYANQLSGTCA